mmetsp:Transcript_45011/g.72289  ORF Transcript_45011/g.72289 Transcript_45011/m.72289 type:complete len:280 (-) Transcript_45011:117-956(-)
MHYLFSENTFTHIESTDNDDEHKQHCPFPSFPSANAVSLLFGQVQMFIVIAVNHHHHHHPCRHPRLCHRINREFLVLNGQQMLRDLNPDFLKRLYDSNMRYAVAQFPMGFLQDKPEVLSGLVKPVIKGVLDLAIGQKVDFYTESVWDTYTNNGDLVLQVRAAPNPPVLKHPETGEPVWFANIHSHSAKLRDMRAKIYSDGDEGRDKTTGSSKINLTDVFYGDGTPISEEDLKHVAEVTMKNVQFVKLNQGDVVLVDNYKTQHGRNVFEGTRKNAVTWFE